MEKSWGLWYGLDLPPPPLPQNSGPTFLKADPKLDGNSLGIIFFELFLGTFFFFLEIFRKFFSVKMRGVASKP
jgi:hypothetical protein